MAGHRAGERDGGKRAHIGHVCALALFDRWRIIRVRHPTCRLLYCARAEHCWRALKSRIVPPSLRPSRALPKSGHSRDDCPGLCWVSPIHREHLPYVAGDRLATGPSVDKSTVGTTDRWYIKNRFLTGGRQPFYSGSAVSYSQLPRPVRFAYAIWPLKIAFHRRR